MRNSTKQHLLELRKHSLKYFPAYPDSWGRQRYINASPAATTLTKFRLGNTSPILICPCCNKGPNNELHLVFSCQAMDYLRASMSNIMTKAHDQNRFSINQNQKLQSFLGGDLADATTLLDRGNYLLILLQKHEEHINAIQ